VCSVVLGAIVFGVHSNNLESGFNYDDQYIIVDNPHYRGLGLEQLAWMFTTFHMGHYQPLSWVTLGFDYLLWGENPRGYHLTNILLHVANALLVFLLALALHGARPLCDGPVRPGRPDRPAGSASDWMVRGAAAAAALLFALHPLRVESVAWITERRDVLSSFFLLLAVLFYLYRHGGAAPARPRVWYALALTAFTLSLLSRALAVTLPAVLLVLDWYPLERLGRTGAGWWSAAARRVYLEKIPFVVLATIFGVLAPLAQQAAGAQALLAEHSILERLAQACYGLVFYLWKTVVPVGLSPLYEIPPTMILRSAKYIVPATVVLGALLAGLRWGRRWPWLTVVVLLYTLLLSPVLGLLQAGPQEVADRYSYLPSVGWAILAGRGLLWLWERPRLRGPAAAGAGAMLLCLVGLSTLTWRQNAVWRTSESLWAHAVRHTPSPMTHRSLAGVYAQAGRLPEAIEQYRASLQLAPRDATVVRDLVKALADTGRPDEAAQVCQQALSFLSGDAKLHFRYGNVLRTLRRVDDALHEYATAVAIDPDLVEARLNLGGALAERGRADEAIAELRQVLELQPNHLGARYNLATALLARGDTSEAEAEYRRVLAGQPDFLEARLNLAHVLERLGRSEEATRELQDVLQRQPHNREAQRMLDALTSTPTSSPAGD
jgi:tetratricopeptide (TPR) repeat protein